MMTVKLIKALQHAPFKNARNRMYRKALKAGENLSIFDVFEIIRNDGYYRHIGDVQLCLALAIDIYTSCSFSLPDEYRSALLKLLAGDGNDFLDLAIKEF
jgi:hypothetical protein